MDENKNIWNKKMDELTVKDAIVINLAIPAAAVAGVVGVGVVIEGYSRAASKIRQFKLNRQSDKLTVVEN